MAYRRYVAIDQVEFSHPRPVAEFGELDHGIRIVGYRITALRQRPGYASDESLINPFDQLRLKVDVRNV